MAKKIQTVSSSSDVPPIAPVVETTPVEPVAPVVSDTPIMDSILAGADLPAIEPDAPDPPAVRDEAKLAKRAITAHVRLKTSTLKGLCVAGKEDHDYLTGYMAVSPGRAGRAHAVKMIEAGVFSQTPGDEESPDVNRAIRIYHAVRIFGELRTATARDYDTWARLIETTGEYTGAETYVILPGQDTACTALFASYASGSANMGTVKERIHAILLDRARAVKSASAEKSAAIDVDAAKKLAEDLEAQRVAAVTVARDMAKSAPNDPATALAAEQATAAQKAANDAQGAADAAQKEKADAERRKSESEKTINRLTDQKTPKTTAKKITGTTPAQAAQAAPTVYAGLQIPDSATGKDIGNMLAEWIFARKDMTDILDTFDTRMVELQSEAEKKAEPVAA